MPLGLERPGGKYWWAEVSSHINSTLKKMSTALAGFHADQGTQAMTLKKLTASLTAEQTMAGAITALLPKPATALSGAQAQQGVIAVSMAQAIVSMMGEELEQGTITAQTLKLVTALAAVEHPLGSMASELAQLTTLMGGVMQPEGVIAAQFPAMNTLVTAIPIESGQINVLLPPPSAALAGGQSQAGVMASALPALSTAVGAAQIEAGAVAASLHQMVSALNAVEQPEGTIASALALASTVLIGGQAQAGVIAATLPAPLTALAGAQTQAGTMSVALKKILAALVMNATAGGAVIDAVGAGGIDENTGSVYSFASNAAAGSTVLVFANTADNFGHQPVNGITCGGVAMNPMAHVYPSNDSGKGDVYCYYLRNIATSNPTIQVTLNANSWSAAQSISYLNGKSLMYLGSAYSGATAAPSVAASPNAAGDIVVNSYQGQCGPITSPAGGTLRSNIATTTASSNSGVSIQDATASTTFSASSAASFPTWASILVNVSAVHRPTVKGIPNISSTTSVTIPTHAVGDLILIVAGRNGNNTVPSKPAASGATPSWNDAIATSGANNQAMRIGWFIATATNHTSGTWTGSTEMSAIVIEAGTFNSTTPIGAVTESGAASTTNQVAPTETLNDTSGASMVLRCLITSTSALYNNPPSGYVMIASTAGLAVDQQIDTTSAAAMTHTTNAAGAYRAVTLEIAAAP